MNIAQKLNAIAELAYDNASAAQLELRYLEVPANLVYLKDAIFTHVAVLKHKPTRKGRPASA